MERFKWEACGARLFQPATHLTSPPSSCFLLTGYDTLCLLCLCFVRQKRGQHDPWLMLPARGVKPTTCAPRNFQQGLAGITVSPSLKWTPSISAREKGFNVDSCLISAFMLWPMCLAQTTWKPSCWLDSGGMKEHLKWTLWPMSSGVITGRDGRDGDGMAAE